MQRLSEDYREKSRYNLDYEQFLLFLSLPGESRETHKWPCACTSLVSFAAVFWMSRNAPPWGRALRDIQKTAARETSTSLAKSEKKKRETTRSLGTTWQSTLSRQLQFYLSKKASHGKFKHLSVLHNSHKWFIVIVLSDLLGDSSYRGTWKKIVQSGISKNERFSSFLANGPLKFKIQLCNRWNLQNRLN